MNDKKINKKNKAKRPSNNVKKKNSKVIKMNTDITSKNLIYTKKLMIFVGVVFLIIFLLIVRLCFVQFVDGSTLKEKAYNQQTINQIISPKRGNIYDSTGKALAIGAQVDTVTINPDKIADKDKNEDKTKVLKEKVAKGLSDIFELNYDEVLAKVTSSSQVETIIKKVEQPKIEQLKTWMKDNNISIGINIDADNKRYYPYGTIASGIIGFCNTDNQGAYGIEDTWNSVLAGNSGKIVSSKDSKQQEIPNTKETYIPAENGSDLSLTVDLNIQTIVEKYLKQAVENNQCKNGGNVIVMDPRNGDILAMANYPNYDLNTPYTPVEGTFYANGFNDLSSEDKSYRLYRMWANKSVSDGYEPGSTFKIITSAVALEENITTTDKLNDFVCNGYETYKDGSKIRTIRCWRDYNPHGSQTLRQSLCNSCNPAFMQLAERIQAPTLFKYYKAFGLMDRTSSGLYGEQNSVFHPLNEMGAIELATYSFGQRFQITPLQMITAISCVANDGILMKPRIVKQITNSDTAAITEVKTEQVRQVISQSTADQVTSMMESVVTIGTGKNAAVKGFSIGGKTGTSEPIEGDTESGYVASYVAISPIENTQVVLLLTLYAPSAGEYQGGQVAGPVVSQMLSEILPYLGVPSDSTDGSSDSDNLITVPDIRNKTVTEAKKILTDAGFVVKSSISGDENTILVSDQTPKPGIELQKSSIIMIYGEGNAVSTSVAVPDLKGLGASQATNLLRSKNLNISIDGTGVVTNQEYMKDELVPEGTVVRVTLKQSMTDAH